MIMEDHDTSAVYMPRVHNTGMYIFTSRESSSPVLTIVAEALVSSLLQKG